MNIIEGLLNGMQLMMRKKYKNELNFEIITGIKAGQRVF